jgi:hypothetical protein
MPTIIKIEEVLKLKSKLREINNLSIDDVIFLDENALKYDVNEFN